MGDDPRKAILARRARFVAAAMAGLAGSACGKSTVETAAPDAGAVTAAPDAEADASEVTSPPAMPPPIPPTPPAPCLRVGPPPHPPQPCLRPAPPPGGATPGGATPRKDAGASCDPPYTIDAQGVKHYKRECLDF